MIRIWRTGWCLLCVFPSLPRPPLHSNRVRRRLNSGLPPPEQDDKVPSTSSTAAGTGEGSSSTAAVRTVLKAPRAGGSATRDWATKTVGGRRGGDKGSRGAKGGGGGGSGSGTGGAWGLEGERVEPNKVLDKDYKGKRESFYLSSFPVSAEGFGRGLGREGGQ